MTFQKTIFPPTVFLSTLLLFACCNQAIQSPPPGYQNKEVLLKDNIHPSFCKVNLWVPEQFNLLQNWTDVSDCSCCEMYKYRFTNAKYCQIKESGFFKIAYCKNNFKRITIEHSCFGNFPKPMDAQFMNDWANNEQSRTHDAFRTDLTFYTKEMRNINGRDFILLDYFGPAWHSDKPLEQIFAATSVKNTYLFFHFDCNSPDCTGFSKMADTVIASIRIDTL